MIKQERYRDTLVRIMWEIVDSLKLILKCIHIHIYS